MTTALWENYFSGNPLQQKHRFDNLVLGRIQPPDFCLLLIGITNFEVIFIT